MHNMWVLLELSLAQTGDGESSSRYDTNRGIN